jgi:eukaryotic-like serine/threonine-protein kinase
MVGHGRYTVIRKLADGGMAEIFLAKQQGSQGFEKTVVLKRIHSALVADEQYRNMLIDEAHISMTLSHNNIVQVLDLGQAGGRYFLALELVDGWDLGRLLHRAALANIALPTSIALYVVSQVCRALEYAHSKTGENGRPLGIVHRDVSPQNVLISEQGEVKLADFGIAKAKRKRDQTDSGVVKGKIAFMSPEQALGREIDARSDIYSVGTLLYMLTTGQRPFDGPTDLEILLRVQKGDYTPPDTVHTGLHPHVAAVIGRAMAFDTANRYPSAHHMLVDIESVLRSSFGSPGQTELKGWLDRLNEVDGEPPISQSAPPPSRTTSVLRSASEFELDEPVTEGPRVGAQGTGRNTRPTLNERSGVAHDTTSLQDLRVSQSLLADEGPPAIRNTQRASSSRFMVAAIIVTIGAGLGGWLWLSSGTPPAATPTVTDKPAATRTRPAPAPKIQALPSSEPVAEPEPEPQPAPRSAPAARAAAPAATRTWRRGDDVPALLEGAPAEQPAPAAPAAPEPAAPEPAAPEPAAPDPAPEKQPEPTPAPAPAEKQAIEDPFADP